MQAQEPGESSAVRVGAAAEEAEEEGEDGQHAAGYKGQEEVPGLGVAVVLEDEGEDVGHSDVGEAIEDEEQPGGRVGSATGERGDVQGLAEPNSHYGHNQVEHIVKDEVGYPVGADTHAAHDLLVLRPILPLLHDEGDDRREFEGEGDGEDEAGEETSDRVVDLLLLICAGHGVVDD